MTPLGFVFILASGFFAISKAPFAGHLFTLGVGLVIVGVFR
jgi:hypothetical protein